MTKKISEEEEMLKCNKPKDEVIIENEENLTDNGRGNWTSKYDYLLSAAGMAIGIGNVWRFPYLCYRNGGGAFLIPYLTMLILVGIPIFLLETSMGQFASSGCVSLYAVCPALKGIGYTSALTTLIASSYYSVVIAYPLVFLVQSFTTDLPWASCGNSWNTDACMLSDNSDYLNGSSIRYSTDKPSISAADEFFHNSILELDQSDGIGDPGSMVIKVTMATVFVWVFTFLCIFKGVNVLGKVVWFTATFPFVMLFILFVRGVTLPGAWLGIQYYIYPDFNKLSELQVWSDAASQIIFSTGIGWGSLITLGSFNKFKNNSLSDALFIPILNCATSIFAGFVVFSVLGFMSHSTGLPIQEVTTGGPSLAFITYPQALSMMPMAPVWSVLFFLMLFFLGIDSLFVQTETIIVALTDEFPQLKKRKPWVAFGACVTNLLLAFACCTQGGLHVLNLLDTYSVAIPILTVCLAEVCVFALIYGGGQVIRDIHVMTSGRVSEYWWIMWMVISPAVLLFMVINSFVTTSNSTQFPFWAKALGWISALVPLSAIPGFWLFNLTKKGPGKSIIEHLKSSHTPSPVWGPQLKKNRQEWKRMKNLHSLENPRGFPSYLRVRNFARNQNTFELLSVSG